MNFYLPTREECQEIVSRTEAFYCTKREVQGFEIELYDYRLASYHDFFPENENKNYSELRGLCFVNNNGTWERNILMQKFFNLNETQDWMYEDVKDKKVDMVQVKEDGSVISFIKLPNENVVAKSKMSFESDQAIMAQEIYDNSKELQSLVLSIMSDNKTAIFELISPFNQIVLPYNETKLVLLQIRDNNTGNYLTKETIDSYLELHNYNVKAEEFELISSEELEKLNIKELEEKLLNKKFNSFNEFLSFIRS